MTGPVVLLVHGLATTSARTWGETGWSDLLRDAGREVIAPDLPGHGSTPATDDMEATLLSRLPAEPVDAVGFSLGGRLVLQLAGAQPDRFRRIVVAGIGANLFEPIPERARMIRSAIAGTPDLEDPTARHFAALAEDPDVDNAGVLALLDARTDPVSPEDLAGVSCPVLVVLGDRDFAGPPGPLVDALPDARLVTLRGVDQFATPKDFGFLDAALDFLDAAPV